MVDLQKRPRELCSGGASQRQLGSGKPMALGNASLKTERHSKSSCRRKNRKPRRWGEAGLGYRSKGQTQPNNHCPGENPGKSTGHRRMRAPSVTATGNNPHVKKRFRSVLEFLCRVRFRTPRSSTSQSASTRISRLAFCSRSAKARAIW
jgi:hypothetical protein